MLKKRILIDLDGVLNNYNGQFDENKIPEIKDGAKNFVKSLYVDYELYLFTSRNLMLAVKWLIKNELDIYFQDVTNVKLPAFLYIDDRAIRFNGNYGQILKLINELKN